MWEMRSEAFRENIFNPHGRCILSLEYKYVEPSLKAAGSAACEVISNRHKLEMNKSAILLIYYAAKDISHLGWFISDR